MQRKPFWKLLLFAIGYMLLGSIMSAIMTVSAAAMIDNGFINVILLIFTLFIFFALVFTVSYKDGIYEQKLVANKRIDAVPANRWIKLGLCMMAFMWIPSALLLCINALSGSGEFMYFYYFFDGAVYPLLLMMISVETAVVDVTVPLVVMGIYVFIPVTAYIGYDFGFKNRFSADVMYK